MKKTIMFTAAVLLAAMTTACSSSKSDKSKAGKVRAEGQQKSQEELRKEAFTTDLQSRAWWGVCENKGQRHESRRDKVEFKSTGELVITEFNWNAKDCFGEPVSTYPNTEDNYLGYEVSDANEMGRVVNVWHLIADEVGIHRTKFKESLIVNIDGDKLLLSEGEVPSMIGTDFVRAPVSEFVAN